ncbi:MarR family winged helix-turn-helix transcriptional regulator [Intestinibacter bartlettii]|uniref:MarR family winged helix-turn-helix transcriptional regulator n=1 Tax=Intestinibacter bartlettii TaxID=261299 RepID=A0ABS6DUL3_9FIRM|nr:MarR family winged helix-turn-helix transcriptional regulator [Intestinibacter bartlettii]MBU5335501.1 MarR family winged helix-turn-helix transcriptional regulator [Intestinibacter bartlettii]
MKSQYPIGLHINKLSRLISRKVDASVLSSIDDNITVSQAYVIDFITDNSDRDVFQKDLEMEFDLKRSSVSLMLNNMEKHDLIKRVPVSEDARLKKIVLTEKAVEISKKISAAIDSVEGQLAESMDQDEINTFLNMLNKIRSNIE